MSASIDKRVFCERIFQIVSQKFDVSRECLFFITTFSEDLDGDDLDQAPVVEAFEHEFGIKIPDDPEGKIKTIGECAIYLGQLAGIEGIEEYIRSIEKEEPRLRAEQRKKVAEKWNREYRKAGALKRIWMHLFRSREA